MTQHTSQKDLTPSDYAIKNKKRISFSLLITVICLSLIWYIVNNQQDEHFQILKENGRMIVMEITPTSLLSESQDTQE